MQDGKRLQVSLTLMRITAVTEKLPHEYGVVIFRYRFSISQTQFLLLQVIAFCQRPCTPMTYTDLPNDFFTICL
jgi:hypothetical protein